MNGARTGPVDFDRVNQAAIANAETVLRSFLSDGRREGREWTAKNPLRSDRKLGSLKVNMDTGKGGDFACGVFWGDFVGMVAYLTGANQRESAIKLADALGVDPFVEGRR